MTDQAVPLTLNWEYASRTGLVALAIAKELRRLAFRRGRVWNSYSIQRRRKNSNMNLSMGISPRIDGSFSWRMRCIGKCGAMLLWTNPDENRC